MEPNYTANNGRNNQLVNQYRALAAQESNVIFGGRFAVYRYYDMAFIEETILNIPLYKSGLR